MYKQVETDKKIKGSSNKPVATLADEYGGRAQIIIDDHCFVLKIKQSDGLYGTAVHWFQEAVDVLKTLPAVRIIEQQSDRDNLKELTPEESCAILRQKIFEDQLSTAVNRLSGWHSVIHTAMTVYEGARMIAKDEGKLDSPALRGAGQVIVGMASQIRESDHDIFNRAQKRIQT